MTETAVLRRRLDRLRAARRNGDEEAGAAAIRDAIAVLAAPGAVMASPRTRGSESVAELATRLADAVDGERVATPRGTYVRRERPSSALPVDREALACLPDHPPADVPLVCLDTETTGLGTATGTAAFVVGLGWWEGETFRQVELLLPDQSEEPALLEAVASHIPPDAWVVTYNGRSFDWPLLETRYRLDGRSAPPHAGHLDLLPVVRRIFRHRLPDARLQTVERHVLDVERHDDLAGWAIPGFYLAFLQGADAAPLAEIARHNHEDVRSLARLAAHLAAELGSEEARRRAPVGDLVGLARSLRRGGRAVEALDCLDLALAARFSARSARSAVREDPEATARVRASLSWGSEALPWGARPWWAAAPVPEVEVALHLERARILRAFGRADEAAEAWRILAAGHGHVAVRAWIELAKDHEHRRRDPAAALEATDCALRLRRMVRSSWPTRDGIDPALDLRRRRLLRKLDRIAGGAAPPAAGAGIA